MKINVNPLSVNKCWQGRRFKTPEYKRYEKELLYLLPTFKVPNGAIYINIVFGFSSKLKDIDNPLKPFLDILQIKYKFLFTWKVGPVSLPPHSMPKVNFGWPLSVELLSLKISATRSS